MAQFRRLLILGLGAFIVKGLGIVGGMLGSLGLGA